MKTSKYLILGYLLLLPTFLFAQKKAVRVYLTQMRNDSAITLETRVLYRPEKRYVPLTGIPVHIFIKTDNTEQLVTTIQTSMNGTGATTLTAGATTQLLELPSITFLAKVDETDSLTAKTKKIDIKPVYMELDLSEENDIRLAKVKVFEYDSAGNKVPVPKIEIKFSVDRPLRAFQFNEKRIKTNDQGVASAIYDEDLPGDEEGRINILARIVDNDDYGTVETAKTIDWGKPTIPDHDELKRSLWASGANAPIALLVFINSLIAAAWGMIFYIIIKLAKIKIIGAG